MDSVKVTKTGTYPKEPETKEQSALWIFDNPTNDIGSRATSKKTIGLFFDCIGHI